jgi:hypothetical protein
MEEGSPDAFLNAPRTKSAVPRMDVAVFAMERARRQACVALRVSANAMRRRARKDVAHRSLVAVKNAVRAVQKRPAAKAESRANRAPAARTASSRRAARRALDVTSTLRVSRQHAIRSAQASVASAAKDVSLRLQRAWVRSTTQRHVAAARSSTSLRAQKTWRRSPVKARAAAVCEAREGSAFEEVTYKDSGTDYLSRSLRSLRHA